MTAVLPGAYLANSVPPGLCPCQWGPSGNCRSGQHEKCPRTWGWPRHGQPEPETHLVGRDWMALVPVWRAGRSCRWLCPCRCHAEVVALFPAPTRGPRRSSGLGGNNRIASTDLLRLWDEIGRAHV